MALLLSFLFWLKKNETQTYNELQMDSKRILCVYMHLCNRLTLIPLTFVKGDGNKNLVSVTMIDM